MLTIWQYFSITSPQTSRLARLHIPNRASSCATSDVHTLVDTPFTIIHVCIVGHRILVSSYCCLPNNDGGNLVSYCISMGQFIILLSYTKLWFCKWHQKPCTAGVARVFVCQYVHRCLWVGSRLKCTELWRRRDANKVLAHTHRGRPGNEAKSVSGPNNLAPTAFGDWNLGLEFGIRIRTHDQYQSKGGTYVQHL